MSDFKNKKVLLLGLGLHGGGAGTADWLCRQGAKLVVSDLRDGKTLAPSLRKLKKFKQIKYALGRHRRADVKWADIIVANPAVPRESPYLKYARRLGKPIINEAGIFFADCPGEILAVTGTRGKSTTAFLLQQILNQEKKTFLAGNIATQSMLAVLDKTRPSGKVVLELSSWQLEGLAVVKKAPHIAVATNLYPDHLNRYKNLRSYYRSKQEIFKYQTAGDYLILNAEDKELVKWQGLAKARVYFFGLREHDCDGMFWRGNNLIWRAGGKSEPILKTDKTALGQHYLANFTASAAAAFLAGASAASIKKVFDKHPVLPGRQQIIRRLRGVTFVNDTTATTPEAGIAALKFFFGQGKVTLIAGGASKKLSYRRWATEVKRYCQRVYLLDGDASGLMRKELSGFKNLLSGYSSLRPAVEHAFALAEKGDIILFSPAAASFNMWLHEFKRGEEFEKIVASLNPIA